jgi:hypothetical protein
MRGFGISVCFISGSWNDTDMLAVLGSLGLKDHRAVNQCKQGVVFATTNIGSGVEASAALANQDVAGRDFLSTKALNAKALGYGIATVAGTTACFLMCHCLVTSLLSR